MESSGGKKRLTGKLLLLLLLILTGWAGYEQYRSPTLQALSKKSDTSLYTVILTQPAVAVAYNPHTHKAVVTTVNRRKLPKDPQENARDLLQQANLPTDSFRYYVPQALPREIYWDQFKWGLGSWRYDPRKIGTFVWEYIKARRENRTNISGAEFLLYSLDLTRLEITDFTVKYKDAKKKKDRPHSSAEKAGAQPDRILPPIEDKAPLAVDDRPLLVEILNASGKKGAAQELTQYLRNQSQKGLLQVDVLQYDNFPGERQPQTRIIDYTGRLMLLKQLSTAIGVNNEITSEKQDTAICDARIIIGEDFKQPL